MGYLVTPMMAGSQPDFHMCSHLKGTIYWKVSTCMRSFKIELKQVRQIPGIIKHTGNYGHHRAQLCIELKEGHFQHHL